MTVQIHTVYKAMMWLLSVGMYLHWKRSRCKMYLYCFLVLLSSFCFTQCKISEYQLESEVRSQCEQLRAVGAAQQQDYIPQCSEDGRYRHVQCNHLGECWCVNGDGSEIPGSRQNTSVVHCLRSCQLQRQRALLSQDNDLVPQCMESGEYQPVQCDGALGQCWCVDLEGMEIYGTRQNGRPSKCPGVCEVRDRRLLHGVGEPSPPQCSDDGTFLPVQCKLINTTNMMVFDLLHTFNRFPEIFQTFSGFRKAFLELSSYCYCTDTRGRELPRTGLELLLNDVYDTAFSSLDVGRSFSQSNMYRILQRRYLAIQLALTGQFRCPTPCESERSASSQAGNVFVPSCDARGNYIPTQCQAGGQCWCVDSDGKEILGTRQHGVPNCRAGAKDCLSERKQALSRLFYGPAGYFSQNNVFLASPANTQKTFSPLVPCSLEFQELLAKSGLSGSLPESEHLDVGDILAEIVEGLFPTGALALKALSLTKNPKRLQENLFGGKILKNTGNFNFTGTVGARGTLRFSQIFSQVGLIQNGEDLLQLARFFSDDSVILNLDQEISDSYGRSVNLNRNRDLIKLIGTVLESEQFFTTLQQTITLLKAEDNTQLGPIFQAVFQKHFCNSAATPSSQYVPQCTEDGQYQEIQCHGSECWCVDYNGLEIMDSRSTGSRPRCPSQCEKERKMAIGVKASRSAGSEVFIPKCEKDGEYVPLQCLGKSCFCMDRTGARHNTLSSGGSLQCPTVCQVTAAQYFLNMVTSILANPASISQLSDVYIPRCTSDGRWNQIQCDGPPEQAFLFYREWSQVNNAGKQLPVSELLNILQEYRRNPEAMASFRGFVFALFQARHQKVFPSLARFNTFSELPSEILVGNSQTVFGPSIFLNPLSLWRLLRGDLSQYPGPLSDFSAPLGHFNLRRCWCVDQKGAMIPDSKASVNQVPNCPGPCSLMHDQVDKFLAEAERLISLSNSSHIPVGYSFLLAESVNLSHEELQQAASPGFQISDVLLSNTNSALHLAAYSTLQFYWQSSLLASGRDSQSLRFGYQPYSPQCDAFGQWLPSQCHPSTGHCWCVDEDGGYIIGSLTARSIQPLQCQSTCQRSQAQFSMSVWSKATSDMTVSYSPSCEEDGDFSVLQKYDASSTVALCVSPATGEVIQPATLSPTGELQCPGWCALQKNLASKREAGIGYEPDCVEDGMTFTPRQCDEVYCWCVSESGREIPSTRSPRLVKTPSCDTPQCPLVFGVSTSHVAILCGNDSVAGKQRQHCEVFCDQGYINALPAETFLCDPVTRTWLSEAPLAYSCQRVQPLQTVQVSTVLQLSLAEDPQSCSVQRSLLQASLLSNMRAAGLCSLQLSSGQYYSICDESAVSLECMSQQNLTAYITFKARLSDLPVNVLPDLHDIELVLSSQMKLDGVMALIRNKSYQSVFVLERTTAFSSPASFSCSAGFQLLSDSSGCVVCPAGSFSSGGRCIACPHGSYQSEAGKDLCIPCTPGTSTAALGAFSPSHCVSECQQSKLNCTEKGDFLSAQKNFLSGKWLCVTVEGEELSWTSADEPITVEQCKVLEKFKAVTVSSLLLESVDAVVLQSNPSSQPLETQIRKCVLDCAKDDSCQYVAVFREGTQTFCDLYSTQTINVECKTSQETKGFLGNEAADTFQALSCLLKVNVGDKPNLTVLRKKGHEFNTAGRKSFKRLSFHKVNSGVYRTLVFEAPRASLDDVHYFCADTCSQESCCDGFILNQNVLSGGSVMCGLLSFPGVLQCSEEDWDVSGIASSSRTCGAGLKYNKQQKRFTFEFGGQNFIITDSALPASSKNKTDYQATIISFQQVYLWTESDMSTRPKTEGPCGGSALLEVTRPTLNDSVKENFEVLDTNEIKTDSEKETPSQRYWVFKHQFTAAEAQLWCLKRCMEEEYCHIADLRDEGPVYFTCMLYPDTRVCGAYDKPLRQACILVLPQDPQTAYQKKVNLTGSVKSFYSRVPFRKMVSYSVRYRVGMRNKSITEGFFECERRCDEDPCCRGIGYVQDTGASDVQCLTLNSLGIQTCGENDRTKWRVQYCSPSKVQTEVYPFGWYEKPVYQWTKSPGICPSFKLRSPSKVVNLKNWRLLVASYVLVDSSVSVFDIVHISRDIAVDQDRVRDWCLAACEEEDSCLAVSMASRESALRCVMYPDTHICLPTSSGQHCVLLIKEPAQYVYLRTGLRQQLTSVSIPGHGTLLGKNEMKLIEADSKSVTYFLGVPYASPPTGDMRFRPPKPADWTGTWNATFARPTCLQPGDTENSSSSEDCLYLNIFVPSSVQPTSVLVFFHNAGSSLLDGSYLAAVGNIIVVTANFRVAAFGFLSTGSNTLSENYGLQDQAAALGWVQENIAHFGGDPTRVTVGADRNGADIASLHLSSSSSSSLFHQALLMGGSVFSPASVMNKQKAQEQAVSLGLELGCSSLDPAQLLICLRQKSAESINAAQTKLLAVSGPLQAWSPVVDGVVVREQPSAALSSGRFHRVPLMLGSSAEDGLISRAKNIKNFEQLQGRADSKTAFYEALSNSLGGDDANMFVKEAATWFYSLQHSPTPSGYSVFSRALENATRDFFITCPSVEMASFWASNTRSAVYMYHLPQDMVYTSVDFSSPLDVQYVFGLPHVPKMRELFTSTERTLSLQIMSYMANFIKSGNPNLPLSMSGASFSELLPPWPQFLPHPNGQNYKELSPTLSNHKSLQAHQCSFWSQYVPVLSSSTGKFLSKNSDGENKPSERPKPEPLSDFSSLVTQTKPKSEKDAYS
ncbi:thyroglobulin isoform X2 [Pangasianodon hypophthalmus]|uniref:thyroglobulin isoform X2 n=1 Tax=Pangasianodon hypophthalmus TaxID=310915 RepID=UPI002308022B|nr:thyroglobulin isoform X2 [Pangasianodon hypophthalmus]